jgi:hypothetical protein
MLARGGITTSRHKGTPRAQLGQSRSSAWNAAPAPVPAPTHTSHSQRPCNSFIIFFCSCMQQPASLSASSEPPLTISQRRLSVLALAVLLGRGLHSSTFRLNISAFCGIGGACRSCVGVSRTC